MANSEQFDGLRGEDSDSNETGANEFCGRPTVEKEDKKKQNPFETPKYGTGLIIDATEIEL